MGKKGKKARAGKPKKLTPKDIGKRLDALVKKLEEDLKDVDLFAPLPPTDDCGICLEPLSRAQWKNFTQMCCGNQICRRCLDGHKLSIKKKNEKNAGKANKKTIAHTCPFCRELEPQGKDESVRRVMARISLSDPTAMSMFGVLLIDGKCGITKDEMEGYYLLIRAAELGSAEACVLLAQRYKKGGDSGFPPRSIERQLFFDRVATARGDISARFVLGKHEYDDLGNHEVEVRHWKIAAEAGLEGAFNALRRLVDTDRPLPGKAFITKDELDKICKAEGFHDREEEYM